MHKQRVLAIIGSPRRGETVKAVEQVVAALGPEAEVDWLFLRELALTDCVGCHTCITRDESRCPAAPMVADLLARMEASDGIILASPTYTNNVTALMKDAFDHLAFLWHRPRFFGKPVLGVATGGGQFHDVFVAMRSNAEAWGATWVGGLGVPHYEALTDAFRRKTDQAVYRQAARFRAALRAPEPPAPSLGRLLWFAMWRATVAACQDSNPADYAYWHSHGWLRQGCYYVGTRIPVWRRLTAAALACLMRRLMRKVYRGY